MTKQPKNDIGRVVMPRAQADGPIWSDVAGADGPTRSSGPLDCRVRVGGKFLFAGDRKQYLCGAGYHVDPAAAAVARDFAAMSAGGVNTVRTDAVPSRWLLDLAGEHGLRLLVAIAPDRLVRWIGDGRGSLATMERVIRCDVEACAGHQAVLGYALEPVPPASMRWHGRRRILRLLERVRRGLRAVDPEGLVAYVNDSAGEFVDLPSLDLLLVELAEADRLEPCLARLHNLAGDRPLVVSGIDAGRLAAALAGGCAGVLLDSWTGPGATIGSALADAPFASTVTWPSISVVVCTYNGVRTIRQCLDGLGRLDYPDYEVIVVDNGSSADIAATVDGYPVRLIRTDATGLSDARNAGLHAATGEIVAYLDDDAWPDRHWLKHLAITFAGTEHVGVGGPNIPPPGDGTVAACVANSPGNPVHVLLTDEEAEHIPGCNMAFRRSELQDVGGFDARYRAAGDDVDVCWRLQARGWTLGFSPAAAVWHHCRGTVRGYLKQQFGYGRAEAMLEAKWPEKYNSAGHLSWAGRVYGKPFTLGFPVRMYRDVRGPSMYESAPKQPVGVIRSLPLMPEWYLIIVVLGALSLLGLLWSPLLATVPLLLVAVGASLLQAWRVTTRARFGERERSWRDTLRLRGLTILLNLVQPLARLYGRLRHGLSPWRRHHSGGRVALPLPYRTSIQCHGSQRAGAVVDAIDTALRDEGFAVRRGTEQDRWDMEVRAGALGACRVLTVAEDRDDGYSVVRLRSWPRFAAVAVMVAAGGFSLAALAALNQAWAAAVILGVVAAAPAVRAVGECGAATRAVRKTVADLADQSASEEPGCGTVEPQ